MPLNYSIKKCKTVLFSDESKYNLKNSDGIGRVCMARQEMYVDQYTANALIKNLAGPSLIL